MKRTLDILAARGFCVDEWARWHQGQCGTYALALIRLKPELRLGLIGYEGGECFAWMHAFAHDDEYAYDAGGRHRLPYKGAWGDLNRQELNHDPEDFGFLEDESGPEGDNLDAALSHALRHGILKGRFTPKEG